MIVANSRPIDVVMSHAQRARREGRGWMVICPAHRDVVQSLHINQADDGRVLLKCHAGCTTESVLAVWGMTMSDLFPPPIRSSGQAAISSVYRYRDEQGVCLFEVCRLDPKGFRQRKPDGTWGVNGTRKVLYHLPELISADRTQRVFVVEGEKDVHALEGLGLVATTNPGGAGKWRSEYAEHLRGHPVVVLPDNDAPGQQHAEQVSSSLRGVASQVQIIDLPGLPEHGDVSSWLDAGHTADELRALIENQGAPSSAEAAFGLERFAAPEPDEVALPPGVERAGRARLYDLSKYSIDAEASLLDWQIPDWIERGKMHLTAGREKRGKTSKALRRMAAISMGAPYLDGKPAKLGRAVFVTEMDEAGILQLIEDDGIVLDWSNCRILFTSDYAAEERLPAIQDACRQWKPDWLGLDPIDECFGLDGEGIFNPSRAAAPFDLMRTLARSGIAIDGLYHLNNVGKIANSYKFRSKPDHLYEMSGEDASDITVKYHGRLRVVPRVRRITGNGIAGYHVETLVGGQKSPGRPADTIEKVLSVLRSSAEPLGPKAVGLAARLTEEAARGGLNRLVASGQATKLDRGLYTVREELDL